MKILAFILAATFAAACAAEDARSPPAALVKVLAASRASDWRPFDPPGICNVPLPVQAWAPRR